MLALAQNDPPSSAHRGVKRLVTEQWLIEVRLKLKESGRTKKDVGESVGSSGPYMSRLLAGAYQSTRFYDSISVELGIDLSGVEATTPSIAALSKKALGLDDDHLADLISYLDFLKAKQNKE